MNMTHPDILKTERFGYGYMDKEEKPIGRCAGCGEDVYESYEHYTLQGDIFFCSEECLFEKLNIERVS